MHVVSFEVCLLILGVLYNELFARQFKQNVYFTEITEESLTVTVVYNALFITVIVRFSAL